MAATLRPEIIVLDAVDPVQDPVDSVAEMLARVPGNGTHLVWGREQPWASKISQALDARGIRFTPIDRLEGVDPLLDLIRSRPRSVGPVG